MPVLWFGGLVHLLWMRALAQRMPLWHMHPPCLPPLLSMLARGMGPGLRVTCPGPLSDPASLCFTGMYVAGSPETLLRFRR
jgi:hypothetical protein